MIRTRKQTGWHLLAVVLLLAMHSLRAAEPANGSGEPATTQTGSTINTLESLVKLQAGMRADIEKLHKQLGSAKGTLEKKDLQDRLDKLDSDLQTTTRNLQQIAAGADIESLRATREKPFNLQEELFSLLRPALKELKDMTSHVRAKSDLKEQIASLDERLPIAQRAISNVSQLLASTHNKALQQILQGVLADWKKQQTYLQSEQQSARLQLGKLEESEETLTQASQGYLKSFFRQRGRYLTEALLVVLGVLLLSRLSYRLLVRLIPGYRAEHRSFRLRLADLLHRMLTSVLVIAGPMAVFYLVEDWVLFSLGILILIGVGLTLRHALPRYWQQIQLFLNVGTVREGERLFLEGLPWRVKQINIFTILENPVADSCMRVRIDELVDKRSHPFRQEDPWFPCQRGDWVLLNDGTRGKVVGISPELVQMVMRGGATYTCITTEFLNRSPVNLSRNFRLKQTIGISYSLQADSVSGIPAQLHRHIDERIREEGYGSQLLNLRVEFERANTSSLDLVVIADFSGEVAELYGRLGRCLQRWCVEACTKFGWEIPFTQLTLHHADSKPPELSSVPA